MFTEDEIKKLGNQQTDAAPDFSGRMYRNASEFYRTIITRIMNVKETADKSGDGTTSPSTELSGRPQNKEYESSFMRRTFLRMRLSLSGNSPRQWWIHSKIYPGNRLYCANGNERLLIQAYPKQTSGYKQNAINFHCRFDESS